MLTIYGKVKKIKYHNPENNYFIIDVLYDKDKKATILGCGEHILCNDLIEAEGEWVLHKYKNKTKEQFKSTIIKKIKPQTRETILEYLSSGIVKGIGKKTALQIVNIWGDDALEIIDKKPNLLTRVQGIGTKKLSKIIQSWEEVKPKDEEISKLINMGFNSYESISIYKHFKEKSIDIVSQNPYFVYQKIRGLNFQKIDSIALLNGIDINNPLRITSGIEHTLIQTHNRTGNTAIDINNIIFMSSKLLKTTQDVIIQNIDNGIEKNIFYCHHYNNKKLIQHNSVHDAEVEIAQKIYYLYNNQEFLLKHKYIKDLVKIKRDGEKEISFSDEQKNAILTAVNSKISILTGKPGTGKTTVLNEIVKQLKHQGKSKILLCAPTGKAAQKMKESTGMEAFTIHRLLDYNPIKDRFEKNINNPLNADVLIIDEASMIDIFLMANLIRAIHNNTQVVIAGDVNQLPSINCGAVLRDIIQSNTIPVSFLNEIKRTANDGQHSKIIQTAHKICDYGEFDVYSAKNENSDFYFIESDSDIKTLEIIKYIIENKVEDVFKLNKFKDLQILAPIHSGLVGTKNLNNVAQELINNTPDDINYISYKDFKYKINDKVIQIRNNYDKDIYNGDSGIITDIESNFITIQFDDKEVLYKRSELKEILPSYCISIHKSQGSEYPLVIIPIPQETIPIMDRSLIYTAITRSKNYAILIGNRSAIKECCINENSRFRTTILKYKLQEYFNK